MSSSTDLGRVQLEQEPHTLSGSLQEDKLPQNILTCTRIVGFLIKKKVSLDALRAHSLAQFSRPSQISPVPGVSSFLCVCVKFQQQSDVLHPDVELTRQPLNGQTCANVSLTTNVLEHIQLEDKFIQNLLLLTG